MAIKNLLPLSLLVCTLAVSAQRLEGRSECRYEQRTETLPNGRVQNYAKEVCVEEPAVEIQRLQIGNVVRIGQLKPHPVITQEFAYKQTRCRWFAETDTSQRDLVQYQGIACEVQPNVWRVIDKF